jgi:hypothetical protein
MPLSCWSKAFSNMLFNARINNKTHALYSTLIHILVFNVFIMHCSSTLLGLTQCSIYYSFIDQVKQCVISILKMPLSCWSKAFSNMLFNARINNKTHALYSTLIHILVFNVFIMHCSSGVRRSRSPKTRSWCVALTRSETWRHSVVSAQSNSNVQVLPRVVY